MRITLSTPEEIQASKDHVESIRKKILELNNAGKKVHFLWDFDGVISSCRSDDVFTILNFELDKYFEYEHRLIYSCPEKGPWAELAIDNSKHPKNRNYVVTARSSITIMRMRNFCSKHEIRNEWELNVGHQSKVDSYRIVLEHEKHDKDVYYIMIDDNEKNITAFNTVAKNLGVVDRAEAVLTQKIRPYNEEELREHVEAVLAVKGDKPAIVQTPQNGEIYSFLVIPNHEERLRCDLFQIGNKAYEEAMVDLNKKK